MKEEVYKKGITNILNLSKFLKHKLLNKEGAEIIKDEISPHRRNKKNNLQNEIKDYLKHSKQVKKYDSIQKMKRDNIKAKNKNKFQKNAIYGNKDNIINEEINEGNINYNENENENEIENNMSINNNQNEDIPPNFVEEGQIEGQNKTKFNKIEDNNNNEVNDEENKNQEEILQENENLSINNNNQKEISKKNNNITDTKTYSNEEIKQDMQINKNEQNLNLNNINEINNKNIKTHLQNMFNEIIYNSFDEFEKNITFKINEMNKRINDISLKISDIQAYPNNINNNSKKFKEKAYSASSYKPAIIENNTSFYINSKKMKLNSKDSKNQSVNTEEPDYVINNKNNIINDNNIDSEVTKAWKETLKLIEKGYINEGYLKLINSGDDIYLLRLICLTGPIIDKLDVEIAKRVLIRVNMISKSHQIQQLLIGLIRNSIKNNVFQMLEPNQQNYILDSLYEFSGLNNSIANEAAELYAELTK